MHMFNVEISGVGAGGQRPTLRRTLSEGHLLGKEVVVGSPKEGPRAGAQKSDVGEVVNKSLRERTIQGPQSLSQEAIATQLAALSQQMQVLQEAFEALQKGTPEVLATVSAEDIDELTRVGQEVLESVVENGKGPMQQTAQEALKKVEEAQQALLTVSSESIATKPDNQGIQKKDAVRADETVIQEQSARLVAKKNVFAAILGGLGALFGDLRISVSGTKTLTDPLGDLGRPYSLQGKTANFLSNLSQLGGHIVGFLLEMAPIQRCRLVQQLCQSWLNENALEKAEGIELDTLGNSEQLTAQDKKDFEALVKGIQTSQQPKLMAAQSVAKLLKQILFVIGTMVAALYIFGVLSMGLAVGLGTGPFAVALGLMTGLAIYRLYKMRAKTLNIQKLQQADQDLKAFLNNSNSNKGLFLESEAISKKTKALYRSWLDHTNRSEAKENDEAKKLEAFQNYLKNRRLYEDPVYQSGLLVEWLSGENETKRQYAQNFLERSKELLGDNPSEYGNGLQTIKTWTVKSLKDIFTVDEQGDIIEENEQKVREKDYSPYLAVIQKAFGLGV